jgi:alanyl-tRNA synthetase
MNQFKDYFLGNRKAEHTRVADTQKCLRVSGKHNDLEEVGVDTYHHTMFEMLGNWSFGDYFKTEAIAWSWELLADVYKIPKDRLYVTVFEGDAKENLPKDEEAWNEWKKWIAEDRILLGNKKDNFWEMGDTGPCGPCTEIHVDCRSDEERKLVDGKTLVNNDHPQVIEIWNNVFIQFNRLKDGSLEQLPAKHVDTGMGFERLTRVLQNKQSNYDTDIFTGTIAAVENIVSKKYTAGDDKESIAFRVLADHIRAICFTIADGQLPSNTGAGYVIRRILRRAVRYYYSYLGYKQPLLHQLVPVLATQFEKVFPELKAQETFVQKVVKEEEDAFLRTVDGGTKLFNSELENTVLAATGSIAQTYETEIEPFVKSNITLSEFIRLKDKFEPILSVPKLPVSISDTVRKIVEAKKAFDEVTLGLKPNEQLRKIDKLLHDYIALSKLVKGDLAFKLQDTYGFPIDLTKLMAKDYGVEVDEAGFDKEMQQQKERSRAATTIDTEDWVEILPAEKTGFVGYDVTEAQTKVVKYRKVNIKGKAACQLVLNETPFYAESGGQVGDTGLLSFDGELVPVTDTKKENDLIIHFVDQLPVNITALVSAKVDAARRKKIAVHHSATHLMHAALRKVLGTHVAQKGSLVNDEYLRFDFSHFAKMTDDEIAQVEAIVNEKIRANIPVVIKSMPKEEAIAFGATALFGEKYADVVRVVIMDENYSIELCGGTHVGSTGELGLFKITSESAVAAGVRRVEAVTGFAAEQFVNKEFAAVRSIRDMLKNPKDLGKAIESLQTDNNELKKKLEKLEARQLVALRNELLQKDEIINNVTFIGDIVEVGNADALKKVCFDLKTNLNDYVAVLCANIDGKPFVAIGISDSVVAAKGLDAGKMIKEHIAPLIKGGGGGQKTLATAGGQDVSNLQQVIEKVKGLL